MENKILDKTFDEERALYNLKDSKVINCIFAGPADGESVLKETRNIEVENCKFSLRYPLWHTKKFVVNNSYMDELTRAAFWYDFDGVIKNSTLKGVKAVRECNNIEVLNCEVDSTEFGWKCNELTVKDSEVTAEYLFLDSSNIVFNNNKMKGKYSFQYVTNVEINDCYLDTKDAFWHSNNVTVKNSTVKGEYLGWFSNGLTLINCKIIGTQPLCYCKNLKLINCTMDDCDLSFEYSDVEATIKGHVDSIKNVRSGKIIVDSVGEIINEDAVMECVGQVIVNKK